MSYDIDQLKKEIIEPTLKKIGMYSPLAVNLLLGTMAKESELGTYIKQIGNGPALGAYQMEPFTHDDRVNNYIVYRKELVEKINSFGYHEFDSARLKYDLVYATIFARIKYWTVPFEIPDSIEGMAKYWKEHYNTENGKGKEKEFIESYNAFIK